MTKFCSCLSTIPAQYVLSLALVNMSLGGCAKGCSSWWLSFSYILSMTPEPTPAQPASLCLPPLLCLSLFCVYVYPPSCVFEEKELNGTLDFLIAKIITLIIENSSKQKKTTCSSVTLLHDVDVFAHNFHFIGSQSVSCPMCLCWSCKWHVFHNT